MFKTLFSEIIHKNPWWTYKHDKFSISDTQEGDYYYGETLGNVIVVPILDDGRLILIMEQRYLGNRLSVGFPGGAIGNNESPIDAAKRELLEETGYVSHNLVKAGSFEPLKGLFIDTSHLFVGMELERTQEQSLDPTENMEILYRRPDEFNDMIKRGEVWDGQTLAAWAIVRDRLA